MAGSTPIYGLPYPEPSDLVANYPALGENLAEKLDEKLPSYQATAPASPSVGQIWIDSDDDTARVWDGVAWLSFSGARPPVVDEANSTGVTFSTLTNPDGDGKNYRLATMTSNCTLKVNTEGYAECMIIGGGSGTGGTGPWGGGGSIVDGLQLIPAATHSVVIGAGGAASDTATGNGGETKIGTVIRLSSGIAGQSSACSKSTVRPAAITDTYSSSITGTATYYGIARDSFSTANGASVPRVNRGDGGGFGASTAGAGSSGVAYIRWKI